MAVEEKEKVIPRATWGTYLSLPTVNPRRFRLQFILGTYNTEGGASVLHAGFSLSRGTLPRLHTAGSKHPIRVLIPSIAVQFIVHCACGTQQYACRISFLLLYGALQGQSPRPIGWAANMRQKNECTCCLYYPSAR